MKKKFAGTYLIALLIMCTFLPFNIMQYEQVSHLKYIEFDGFYPIWYNYTNTNGIISVIAYKRLFIQIIIVTMAFIILYFSYILKKKLAGTYLVVLLIMFSTLVPFNTISSANKLGIYGYYSGYYSIWYSRTDMYWLAINYKQLFFQIVIITMAFAIIYLFLPNKKIHNKNIQNTPL